MDKISKALKKLTEKERKAVKEILVGIGKGEFTGLNIKKLKGRKDIFRVRKRVIRIIFQKTDTDIFVLSIERRSLEPTDELSKLLFDKKRIQNYH